MFKIGKYRRIKYKENILDVEKSKYLNGRIALQATLTDHSPFAVLTVNIPAYDEMLDADMIILDTNNVPDIDKALTIAGLVTPLYDKRTGKPFKLQSGYCMYPVVRWLG